MISQYHNISWNCKNFIDELKASQQNNFDDPAQLFSNPDTNLIKLSKFLHILANSFFRVFIYKNYLWIIVGNTIVSSVSNTVIIAKLNIILY